MNTGSNSNHSNNLKPCTVTSKYFTKRIGMDESLSDFQEKKKSCTGPKHNQKINSSKWKTRKTVKPIKGQNDIRSVLKKNELLKYSKNFDDVCKKSGIDVDSEQLQLAIALSKSLQSESKSDNESQSSEPLNLLERTKKLRATLQEYGFVIPEIKTATANRRSIKKKRFKKQYKLLLMTESEKQQIVFDKYSQVLFQNIDRSKEVNIGLSDASNAQLYYVCSNICYKDIKNNHIFYVDNLLEKSSRTIGCLLKDWSGIPGRPVSPVLYEKPNMDFSEIDCSQDELDAILSGSLKSTKDVLKNLDCMLKNKPVNKINLIDENVHQDLENHAKSENGIIQINEIQSKTSMNLEKADNISSVIEEENVIETMDCILEPQLSQCRSISPDIFEDYVSSVMDDTNHILVQCQELTQTVKEDSNYMDLTECVNVILENPSLNCEKTISQISQGINITRRKSNDFMEITNCVTSFSKPIPQIVDLTLEVKPKLVEASATSENNEKKNNVACLDLTQSSDSSDDSLPFVQISGKEKKSFNDTVVLDENDIEINTMPISVIIDDIITDNTVEASKSPVKHIERCSISSNEINFEDYSYNHSSHSSEECLQLEIRSNSKDNDIDLTQTSNSSEERVNRIEESQIESMNKVNNDVFTDYNETYDNKLGNDSPNHHYSNNVSLGKNNISTDYDEIDDRVENESQNHNYSIDYDIVDENSVQSAQKDFKIVEGSSSSSDKDSEIFEISDKELNYSVHASLQVLNESYNLGGISANFNKSNNVNNTKRNTFNRSRSDSFLPPVEIKNNSNIDENRVIKCRSEKTTPIKEVNTCPIINIETPENSSYIIKTDHVTPMLDYESMSTPEVHQELNKYGLKPFKRKRAIQLLTHLYNQTHPIVEPYLGEESPSTPKRLKYDSNVLEPSASSGKVLNSPRKTPEPFENLNIAKVNSLYEVTNEVPVIKEIECNSEDWIFQKKENAKVDTCRVPLHIAFHNYVTSRRALRESIQRYDPVDIDIIHKGLKDAGHLYCPKDLLKFMDKKCITVKITDNNSRNKRY